MTPIASAFWGLTVAWAAAERALRPVAEAKARERAFVCTTSHDLVTPLMAVTTNCDVLEAEASDQASLASWVANIRAAADEMATRIADMLMHMGDDQPGRSPQRALLSGKRLVASHAGVRGLSRQAPHRGTAMVATAPPEGLLASETEPPWVLAASEAAWRPSP